MGRYTNIPQARNRDIRDGVRFYTTVLYPSIPLSSSDIYVITTDGDRLDLLANEYYGDYSLYWIISAANDNLPQNSIHLPAGTQLRIPQDITGIINSYEQLNNL